MPPQNVMVVYAPDLTAEQNAALESAVREIDPGALKVWPGAFHVLTDDTVTQVTHRVMRAAPSAYILVIEATAAELGGGVNPDVADQLRERWRRGQAF